MDMDEEVAATAAAADKGTVNTDMLLNNDLPTKGIAEEEKNDTQVIGDGNNSQRTAVLHDGPMVENAGKLNDVEMARESKSEDLDIESMLAAIHNDNSSPNTGNVQNLV